MRFYKQFAAVVWVGLAFLSMSSKSQATAPAVTNISPNFGVVGTSVTVYGTNFGTVLNPHSIKFNGVAATVTSWTNTVIKATVPTTTTGTIQVTTSAGSVTTSVDFDVLPTNGALAMGSAPQVTSCPALPAGHNCITEYGTDVIPDTDGIVIVVPWAEIEQTQGTYTWTWLDNAVANYTGQTSWDGTKKLGIVLSPVTSPNNTPQENLSTPGYVFTSTYATSLGVAPQDECTCPSFSGDSNVPTNNGCWNWNTSHDTTGFPAVWETPFQTALQNFYSDGISYLNNTATYNSSIAYIRLGLSAGGEEYPWCYANLETLVSPSTGAELKTVWTTNANTMFTYAAGLGSEIPLMAAPDGGQNATVDYTWADAEAADATAVGINLGSEGFQSNDTFSPTHCANDWCYTFSTYAPQITELQTFTASDLADNNCSTDYSGSTGSLVCLLPFAEGKANVVEIYNSDMFTAYDSNDSNYSTYGAAYATAIANLRSGH